MSNYKFHRVFRRYSISYAIINMFITLTIWSFAFAFDVICFLALNLYKAIRYLFAYIHYRKINYSQNDIIRMIRNMSPREFEVFIAEMFKSVGYEVELTPETCDGGVDVKIRDNNGRLIYIEAKHFAPDNYVGRVILQKAYGAAMIDKADECIIITTGQFHQNAIDESIKVENLTLMDLDDILLMLRKIDVHLIPRIFVKTFNGQTNKLSLQY